MYKFKSHATGDLIMLEPNGRQMLTIIGKLDLATPSKGILLPQEMSAAIAALQAAIAEDDARRLQAEPPDTHDEPLLPEGIPLRQRAIPLIKMLLRSQSAVTEVVWGV